MGWTSSWGRLIGLATQGVAGLMTPADKSKLDAFAAYNAGAVVGTYTTNAALGDRHELSVAANFTLANPTNLVADKTLTWVIQIPAGVTPVVTFGNKFRFTLDLPSSAIALSGYKNILVGKYDAVDDRVDVVAFKPGVPLTLTVAAAKIPGLKVAWWMDEAAGPILDHSGSGHDGVVSGGLTYGTPPLLSNEPYLKTTTGGFIEAPHAADLNFAAFTVAVYVEPSFPGTFPGILGKAIANVAGQIDWAIYFNAFSGYMLAFTIGTANNSFVANPPATGVPVLIVCTYDGVDFNVYYDNVLVGAWNAVLALPTTSGAPLSTKFRQDNPETIGGRKGPHFVWNRAISAPERASLLAAIP